MRVRIFIEPQMGATYAHQLAVATTAEQEGFEAFFRSDHYLHMGGDPGPGPTDAWATLAGLARETTRIRLGTLVTPITFRLPGPLAITVAQVDAMSGGRVELGLGAGWFEAEHKAYAIPFPSTGERFDRLEEQLAVITGLWKTAPGATFDYGGTHYQLTNSPALPKPHQSPHPPIVIGGAGPRRTPRLAARYANEYNTPFFPNPDLARGAFDRVRAACERIGRDPATMTFSSALTVCCGKDAAELERRATNIGRPLDRLRTGGAAGTPSELVDRLGSYADAGAEVAYLQVLDLDDLDHIRLIAAEVLPNLRQ
jgi:F420-dependent oxidoreductase-like protein